MFYFFVAAAALAQDVPRQALVPGGIVVIPLGPDTNPAPIVHFDGNRVLILNHVGQWQAIVGLPLNVNPGEQIITVMDNHGARNYSFTVQPKKYIAQHLTLKNKNLVNPTEDELKRIVREQTIISNAFATWTETPLASLDFRLPVQGRISSTFGLRRFYNNEERQPHSGLDIAAPIGTAVAAPFAGSVIETGSYFFNGNTVFLDHGQGLISMFNHLSRIGVKIGERVQAGQKIGEVGMSGRATGPHLHWTISLNNSRVDPEFFLPERKLTPKAVMKNTEAFKTD
ncbi:MAG: peptidoglycan DD-metalloendopeptidase family protein [Gammaproteobacteria bacterium]|nr:peptidoglycan DD-metalloendopeptidase family protein [Gammaproteobacteria bacterium]